MSNLIRVLYDDAAEATSRIAIDYMLIACKLHIMNLHLEYFFARKLIDTCDSETSQKFEEKAQIKIYSKLELTVKVVNLLTKKEVRVTKRAD